MRNFWTAITLASLLALPFSQPADAGVIAFGSGGKTFNMEFVAIGNLGNADDTTGSPTVAGKVDYAYQMGKFEVSRDMVIKANAAGSLGITLGDLTPFGGNGVNRPATGVTWNEAARFVNWLNTSTGGFAAYNATGGVNTNITPWTALDTLDYDANNPYRSMRTNYVLPSMDEWYKAAYYDPNTSTYFDFPNGSDTAPTPVSSGTAANTAVYGPQAGPADIMSAGGLSPYGIMGLGGNVFEREETAFFLDNSSGASARGFRGGNFIVNSVNAFIQMSSSARSSSVPTYENNDVVGFRVASLSSDAVAVPEPSSLIMFTTMALSALWYRKRLRK